MKTKEYKRLLGYYVASKRRPTKVGVTQSKRTVRAIGGARGQKWIEVCPVEIHHY
jgi:hypothetical protein